MEAPKSGPLHVPSGDGDFYRDVVNLSLDMVALLDSEGAVVYQSPSAATLLGYLPEHMVGRRVFEFVHPDDAAATAETMRGVLGGETESRAVEVRLRRKDGEWRYVEVFGRRWDLYGEPHLLLNARDVTDRQQALMSLARTNELLSKTLQSSRNIVSITGADTGEFIEVNDEWLRVSGFTREEVIGRTANELGIWGDPANRERVIRDIREAGGQLRDYEITTYPRTGARHFVINVETLTVSGEPLILMTGTDVTESRITEEKLRHSQKMEAVGQLTGGVAHDFNNLLSIILGNAELLRLAVADDVALRSLVDPIVQASGRGATLTRQLLAFSRRQVLAPQPVHLNDAVAGMMPLLRTTLGPTVAMHVQAQDGLRPCLVDPAELENAVLNLVFNARDALPEGGQLRLEMTNQRLAASGSSSPEDVPPGDYVALAVVDDGRGMDAETVRKAFDPFFTTKEAGRGTGLGLSMVFGFVRQSGGQVTIDSAPGAGTRVTLLLPAVPAAAEATPADTQAGEREIPRARGETVLVLDDEPALLELVGDMLAGLGYGVLTARDEAAVERVLAAGEPFDLLLSDVMLTGPHRGSDVARTLLARRPGTPVLYMSGYPPRELNHETLPGMCGRLLRKPFTRADLARQVRHSLER